MRVNRTATAWLIRHVIDADAAFLFEDVAEVAGSSGARER
jgi:hypothetical protein